MAQNFLYKFIFIRIIRFAHFKNIKSILKIFYPSLKSVKKNLPKYYFTKMSNLAIILTYLQLKDEESRKKIFNLRKQKQIFYFDNITKIPKANYSLIKKNNNNIKLHLIGKLQTNKVKFAVKLFDYIHSLDSEKLANKISSFGNSNLKIFIQVNLGNEEQKSGINANNLLEFYNYCKELKLNIIGLMCIPPLDGDTNFYFNKMLELKKKHSLNELSMGMSSDYLEAINFEASYIRIGSSIFGKRY